MVRILLFRNRHFRSYILFGAILIASTSVYAQSNQCDTTGRKVMCTVKDSTGYVLEIHRYKDGMKWGSWERYNYNGQLIEKNFYKKGVRIWTFIYRDEEVIKSINKNGKIKKFKGCGCG